MSMGSCCWLEFLGRHNVEAFTLSFQIPASFTSVAYQGGLHMSAADYCPFRRLLFSRVIRQSSWEIKAVPPVSSILRLRSIACSLS